MRASIAFAFALGFVLACDKPKDDPKPTPPTPTPVTPTPVTPAPKDASVAQESACETLIVFLETGGTWIGAPPDISCFGASSNGARDDAWLRRELEYLKSTLAGAGCEPELEIAAANGVTYQELIWAIDLGVTLGLTDVGVSNPVALSMQFTALRQPKCDGKLSTKKVKTAGGRPSARLSTTKDDLATAPVIIVTRDAIRVADEDVITIAEAMKGSNKHAIPELQRALPAATKQVILQADASTDAKVINRIISTTTAADIDNVLFAVKNR